MSFLSVVVGLCVLFPGILALSNDSKDRKNRLFLGVCLALSIWVFSNTLVDIFDSTALLFTRLTFISITLGLIIFWDFTHYFPLKSKFTFPRKAGYAIALTLAVIEMTSLFIPSVEFENGVANVVQGPVYLFFVGYYLLFLGMSIRMLIRNIRIAKGIDRQKTKMILLAMAGLSTWASITNLILPLLVGNNNLAPFGSYAALLFTGLIGYAMLRHHLFDIRLAIARAVTYVAAGSVLVGLYIVVYVVVASLVGVQGLANSSERIIYAALTLFSAVIFHPLRTAFDRLTNRIFFKGDYNIQDLLDTFNDEITNTNKLNDLITNALKVLQSYLKSEATSIGVITEVVPLKVHIFSTDNKKVEQTELQLLEGMIQEHEEKLFVYDTLKDKQLKYYFKKHSIEVLLSIGTSEQHVGYLGLSSKKNGEAYSKKDIQVLGIVADELAVAIQNSLRYEEISKFNLTLLEEVEDATKRLQRTNDKLKALDETKDEFISMASHQLRTPLTSVKGYLSMVLEGDAGPLNEQQEKLLNQAFISSQRMVYLIADLLNVSRLRTGKFVIERKSVGLPDIVSGELDQLHEAAKAKGLKLHFEPPKDFPNLLLDETKTRQIIMNFIDNAMYYTPAGGKIKIELEAKPRTIEFRVVDNGLGVPRAEQRHLFTKFYRANNARRMRPDGTGLGLFMAKKVIIAQGGAVIFKSAEGKGSTFGFTFPRTELEVNVTDVKT